jgi:hypothetical protein
MILSWQQRNTCKIKLSTPSIHLCLATLWRHRNIPMCRRLPFMKYGTKKYIFQSIILVNLTSDRIKLKYICLSLTYLFLSEWKFITEFKYVSFYSCGIIMCRAIIVIYQYLWEKNVFWIFHGISWSGLIDWIILAQTPTQIHTTTKLH